MSTKKDTAVAFLQLAASGRARDAFEMYAAPGFRHHNPHFEASPEALRAAMDANAREFPDKQLEVKLALEDGDLVSTLCHVRHTHDETGYAVAHIFRFAGTRIVELWDLAQEIPRQSPNANGMF
jgi:predicted SnoaL-like aldol condensation-catalyzing enzyme